MMRTLRALLPKDRLRRAVTLSVSGTALAQLIVLAASPLLTRIYIPEEFGILGVFSALLGILGMVVCLRYELAIPLAEDDRSVINLLALSLAVTLLVSGLIGLTLGLWGDVLSASFNAEALYPLLWLLPVGLVAVGFARALTHWGVRRGAFGRITQTRVSRSVGQVIAQVGGGYAGLGAFGLLIGQVIGQSAGVTTLAIACRRTDGDLWRRVRLRRMARAAARYAILPTYATGAALLNSGGRFAPALFVAALYGAEVAGWFALAQRILGTPLLFSAAVAQVYLSEAPRLARTGGDGAYQLFKVTSWRLLAFGLLSLGPIVVVGPQLFALIFGSGWTEAGRLAQFLALMSLAQLVVSPVSQTLAVVERQDIQLAWDAGRAAAVVLVFLAARELAWSATLTVAVLSLAMTSCYILLFVVVRQVLLAHLRSRARHPG